MTLNERLAQAIDVLYAERDETQTLRQEAGRLLNAEVDDNCMAFLQATSHGTYQKTLDSAKAAGYNPTMSRNYAQLAVMVLGMALGRRLGLEDGEAFTKGMKL